MVDAHSAGGAPRHLPAQAIDYCSGYLLAFGAMAALYRRTLEGGSYLVRVSLAQTGYWIWNLGTMANGGEAAALKVDDLLAESDSPFGRLRFLSPAVQMSETPARWSRPAVALGYHEAVWPPRGQAPAV